MEYTHWTIVNLYAPIVNENALLVNIYAAVVNWNESRTNPWETHCTILNLYTSIVNGNVVFVNMYDQVINRYNLVVNYWENMSHLLLQVVCLKSVDIKSTRIKVGRNNCYVIIVWRINIATTKARAKNAKITIIIASVINKFLQKMDPISLTNT